MYNDSPSFVSSFVAFMFSFFIVYGLDEFLNEHMESYDFIDSLIVGTIVFAILHIVLKQFFSRWM